MTSTSQRLIDQNYCMGTQYFRRFWCPRTTGCPYSLSKMYGNRRKNTLWLWNHSSKMYGNRRKAAQDGMEEGREEEEERGVRGDR